MSVMHAITNRHRTVLLTDAAFYHSDGVVTAIRSKCFGIPGIKAAYSARGTEAAFLAAAEYLEGRSFRSYDAFRRDGLAHMAAHVSAEVARIDPEGSFEMMIAGWCGEDDTSEVVYWRTHDNFDVDAAMFVPRNQLLLWRDTVVEFGAVSGPTDRQWDHDSFVVERDAMPLMEHHRSAEVDFTHGAGEVRSMGCGVGGFVQATTIDRTGVRSEVLHEWPDRIGERIAPFAGLQTREAA